MKSLTANFTTEKDKRGTTPVSLLEIDLPSPLGTLRLAGHDVTVGTDEYKGLVKEWPNQIYNRVSGDLHTPDIGDVRITLVNTGDGDKAPFMRYLQAVNIEGAAARIYQWFSGLTAVDKDLVFTGVIQGPIEWNEETLSFDIVSGVSKDRLVGDKVLASDYAAADPDDIGRVKPIVYGTVENFPCLAVGIGANDLLRDNFLTSDPVIKLSDASRFPFSGTVKIGSESVTYSGKSSNDLTGLGSHSNDHLKGDAVWEVRGTYDYLVTGHPDKALADIRVNGLLIPSANYTLDLTNSLIKFDAHPIGEFLSDHLHDIGVSHSTGASMTQYPTSQSGGDASYIDGNENSGALGEDFAINFSNTDYGTIDTQFYWVLHDGYYAHIVSAGGSSMGTLGTANAGTKRWERFARAGGAWSDDLTIDAKAGAPTVTFYEFYREMVYTGTAPTPSETGKQIPGLDFWRGALVTCKVDGKKDDDSGTITGTPNALIERPDHVFKDFLINVLGHTSGDIDSTSFNASGTQYNTLGYLFAGAITQPEQARDILARLAFQCRSWFFWDGAGKAHLVIRELYDTPDKAIGKERIVAGSLRLARTSTESIRNKISLHYDRNWTVEGRFGVVDPELPAELREAEKGFKSLIQSSHSASQTAFGARERAYYFDFVVADAMAADLAGFYLSLQAYPRSRVTFKTYLPNYELERGDRIGLTHTHFGLIAHDLELVDVSQIIGSGRAGRMDAIAFVAEGRAIKNQKIGGRQL